MTDTSETSATSPDLSRATETPEDESPTVCYLCRQRKTKCDRKLPRCGYCVKAKINCQYVAQPKKRGLRAGYVSELEARIGKHLFSFQLALLLKARIVRQSLPTFGSVSAHARSRFPSEFKSAAYFLSNCIIPNPSCLPSFQISLFLPRLFCPLFLAHSLAGLDCEYPS